MASSVLARLKNNSKTSVRSGSFCRKIDTKTDDFRMVLKTINTFLSKPFKVAVISEEFTKKWSSADGELI